jgi:hypothetical protein
VISNGDQKRIIDLTCKFWNIEVDKRDFRKIFKGKEIGHRIANDVDEKTTEMLKSNFSVMQELNKRGKPTKRSMGDLWIQSNHIYNPVNVKSGLVGAKGQPNMVALNKLLAALLCDHIDSYYLLFVKMTVPEPITGPIIPHVYLVDILDWLDRTVFQSGPGQILLKEELFFADMNAGIKPVPRSLDYKVLKLGEMLKDGDRRLFVNRRRKAAAAMKKIDTYRSTQDHAVNQKGRRLG